MRIAKYKRTYKCNVRINVLKIKYNDERIETNEYIITNKLKQTNMIQQITNDKIANEIKKNMF